MATLPARVRTTADSPLITIRLDDSGFAHRVAQNVRLFEGPDLYSAKRPKFDLWGAGVTKVIAALGWTITPMVVSPALSEDGSRLVMRPGRRIFSDPQSGVPTRIEQDVRLTGRHPANGSWVDIIATGQIDLHHLLVQALSKIQREDICRVVTSRVKARMEDSEEFDAWAFYAYGDGVWLAANLTAGGVRDVLREHREQARTDKALGFATSKAIRLALKQANVIPTSFLESQLRVPRDQRGNQIGPAYIDLLVPSWVVCEDRTTLQQSIDAMLARSADTIDAAWQVVGDDEDSSPDEAEMIGEIAPAQIEAPREDLEQARPAPREPERVDVRQQDPEPEPVQQTLAPPPSGKMTAAQKTLLKMEEQYGEAAAQGRKELGLVGVPVIRMSPEDVDRLLAFLA